MDRDLVLIPTNYRPELLYLCLERVTHSPGSEREIWLLQDRHTHDFPTHHRDEQETREVLCRFSQYFPVRRIIRRPHGYPGNSFNIMEAYKAAYRTNARYVFLIEEDVLITEDFFRWHEAVQSKGDYFCSIGYRCTRNPHVEHRDDPEGYLECADDYASIGVCWRRTNLAAVVEHATARYYSDPSGYVTARLPQFGVPTEASEQDGLILRLKIADSRPAAWASFPRAYHIGVWGYHRPNGFRFPGTLEERVNAMRQATLSTDALRSLSRDRYNDVEAPPLQTPAWRLQRVLQSLGTR